MPKRMTVVAESGMSGGNEKKVCASPARADYVAGEPCRGCGEPMQDGLGDWFPSCSCPSRRSASTRKPTQRFRERTRRTAGMLGGPFSGSRVTHCCFCCPPPPIGPKQMEKLAGLFASWLPREESKKDLDTWDLTLRCDHVVPHIQHREHSYVLHPASSTARNAESVAE